MLCRGLINIYPVAQMMITYKISPVILSPVYHHRKYLNALVFPFSLIDRIQFWNGFLTVTAGGIPETDNRKIGRHFVKRSDFSGGIRHFEISRRQTNQVCHDAISAVIDKLAVFLGEEICLSGIDIFIKNVNKYRILPHEFRIDIFLRKIDQQKLKHVFVGSGKKEHVIYFPVDGISLR